MSSSATKSASGGCTLTVFAMESILIALLAAACLVYLVVAVLRPEKF